jgi:hypothetical protein
VQDNVQKGFVDLKAALRSTVLDESQLSEFVHEIIDPRSRRSDHLRQHLLRHLGQYLWGGPGSP